MKLSEAIMLGACWPQCTGSFRKGNARCAVGGALESVGFGIEEPTYLKPVFEEIGRQWPDLICKIAKLPCACSEIKVFTVFGAVIHLNDDHLWSRERIAEWVASIESRESEPQIQPVAPAREMVTV